MIEYHQGELLPDLGLQWEDATGAILDLLTGYTFGLKMVNAYTNEILMTKTTGITGASTTPNLIIAFTAADFTTMTPGLYIMQITATRTSGAKPRTENYEFNYVKTY